MIAALYVPFRVAVTVAGIVLTARVFDVSYRDIKQEGIVRVTVRVAHARTEDEARSSALLTVEELGDLHDFTPDGPGVVTPLGPQGDVAGFVGSVEFDSSNC